MKPLFITTPQSCPLDQLLNRHLSQNNRGINALQAGGIWRENQRLTAGSEIIRPGETVRVYHHPDQNNQYTLTPADILLETRELVAVYKPPLLASVPDYFSQVNNITFSVNRYLRANGINRYETTAISRLDYPVQGIMVFPKSKRAEMELHTRMQARQIHKHYTALLTPTTAGHCLRIKNKLDFVRGQARESTRGKPSESLFIPHRLTASVHQYGVILFTGRRHQIRVHAATGLAPLLGDTLYGNARKAQALGLIASGTNFPFNGHRYRIRIPQLDSRLEQLQQTLLNA